MCRTQLLHGLHIAGRLDGDQQLTHVTQLKACFTVDDKGHIVGIDNARRLMEELSNKIQNILGIVSDVNLLAQDGKAYIQMVTLPYEMSVAYDGG